MRGQIQAVETVADTGRPPAARQAQHLCERVGSDTNRPDQRMSLDFFTRLESHKVWSKLTSCILHSVP